MEENPQPKASLNVSIRKLCDSKLQCNRKQILEYIKNLNPDEKRGSDFDSSVELSQDNISKKGNYIDILDKNTAAYKNREVRKIFRRCKLWRRENIKEIEKELALQKSKDKLIISHKVTEQINKSNFSQYDKIDDVINIMERELNLIFDKNERERYVGHDLNNQKLFLVIKDKLNEINQKFVVINDEWVKVDNNEDLVEAHDDFAKLKKKSLDILEQKDYIISKLVDRLEELIFKSENEIEVNNEGLAQLNKNVKSTIETIKEDYDKKMSTIIELIESETTKKNERDTSEWKQLMDKNMNKITDDSLKRLTLFEKNESELVNQRRITKDHAISLRMEISKKNIGLDADLNITELKCSENTKKLIYNCQVLDNRIQENTWKINSQRRQIVQLQEKLSKMKAKYNNLEIDYTTKIPIIQEQILKIKERTIERQNRADDILKNNNCVYLKCWNLEKDKILSALNSILKINKDVHEFLGIGKDTPDEYLGEIPTISRLPALKHNNMIDVLARCKRPSENSTRNHYQIDRDKALDHVLLNFIVKNSSFMVEDQNSDEAIDTNPTRDLTYMYNVLSAFALNTRDNWDLMKSKFKPFVVCATCKYQIKWNSDEHLEVKPQNAFFKQTAFISDNDRLCGMDDLESRKNVLEKLCTHVTRHHEYIDKVYNKPESLSLSDDITINSYDITNENISDEEQHLVHTYSTSKFASSMIIYEDNYCINAKHELFIDNKNFIPVMKEILKEIQKPETVNPEKYGEKHNFVQWEISEKDLQDYWSQFMKIFPESSIILWDRLDKPIRNYHKVLVDRQKKLLRINVLKSENKKLKKMLNTLPAKIR